MATTIYTVPSTKIVHETKVDFSARHDYCPPIYLVQYDNSIPIIAVTLRNQQTTYKLDDTHEVWIRWRKPDNTFVRKKALGCNTSKNVVYFEVTQQMVMISGNINPVVELIIPGSTDTDPQVASSASFNVFIERNPIQNGDMESIDQYEDPYGNVVYSKRQIDANFYNKTQADKKFAPTIINGDNISNGSVSLPKLTSYVTNLLYIINKSNYTLLFDSDFRLVSMYDITSIGAATLNSPTAKYLFVPSKVTKIQSGAGAKLPKLTNVYINHFKDGLNVDSGAFSSGVSIFYVKDSTAFNTLDYFVKDLLITHADINSKYNSSSIEYGTSTLEIYSSQTDKTKSATCMYKRVGNTVTAVIKLIMNAVALPAPGTVLHYKQMPFKNMDVKTMCVGVSDNDHKVIKGQVTSSGWLQVVSTTGTALSFAQDEEIDFTVTYRVNKT